MGVVILWIVIGWVVFLFAFWWLFFRNAPLNDKADSEATYGNETHYPDFIRDREDMAP